MSDPIVLLPGMMCDARLFGPQIAELSADYAVQVSPVTRGETIDDIARQVLAGAPERFALAGLSMGGIVAMEVWRRAPERVTRLCLMDTNCMAELPTVKANREPQIARVKAGRLRDVMADEMKPNYLADGPYREEVMAIVMDMALALGPEVFVRQSRALMRRFDQQGTLKRMGVMPVDIICGRHDALCPPMRHEFMAGLIGDAARLTVIEGAGHLPTLETPD
jgi:pimeloyl-ACP methyl ester carboxylesterase